MLARGLCPGDRVVLHMANLPEMAVAYHACLRIGAIAAPLNIRFKTAELRPLLQRLQPSLYLGQAKLYEQVADISPEILPPSTRYVLGECDDVWAQPWAKLFEDIGVRPIPSVDADAPALLLATSGTTGVPKFVTHTATTLSAVVEAAAHLAFDGDQVAIHAVPMVHASGFFVMLMCVRHGAPMILLERFDPEAVLDAIEGHRATWLLGLPFMYDELMKSQRARPRTIESLRVCLSCGDVCPMQVQRDFPDVFGVPLYSFWGASETAGSLTYGAEPGPVSRIVRGAPFRLVDDEGVDVPHGEVGELLISGPNLTVGYWVGPGRIDGVAPDGWFHTGDLMRQGEGDDIWFVARKKDLIIRGGSNVSPLEVERVLLEHPAVRDAAVVGIPDTVLGQRVAAVVQLRRGTARAALDDILVRTKAQLADYKVPERLRAVDSIPRNAIGKVDRNSLAAMLADDREMATVPR
jgi:acyl-CoA synthetase (AMP-forming)/AMP-acid ligase II